MHRDRAAIKAALLDLLRRWDREEAAESPLDSNAVNTPHDIKEWLTWAQAAGWTRRDVHALVWDIFREYDAEFTPATMDALGEVETALTGSCEPGSIIRFPGDPEDLDSLAAVARDPSRW